ncbi:hypothetical protein BDV26DRAFT_298206 [Aspergillus bertholletiae]|uniref:Heterokaryon incompatibility domain-containing protein n=1 Tax=Aspergillus bertholletiae TaxID=1226010 RepID=A0A5N7AQD6_9EURO|nr:hypothetical protein BDV26DRAFT_298206 [Aspergillus bertholletiae]
MGSPGPGPSRLRLPRGEPDTPENPPARPQLPIGTPRRRILPDPAPAWSQSRESFIPSEEPEPGPSWSREPREPIHPPHWRPEMGPSRLQSRRPLPPPEESEHSWSQASIGENWRRILTDQGPSRLQSREPRPLEDPGPSWSQAPTGTPRRRISPDPDLALPQSRESLVPSEELELGPSRPLESINIISSHKHKQLEKRPSRPRVSIGTYGPLQQMFTWLEVERRSLSLSERNQSMPQALRAINNIDQLCSTCKEFPWGLIWKQMYRGRKRISLRQQKRQLSTMRKHLMAASEGCHLCTLICVAIFCRGARTVYMPRWQEYHQSLDDLGDEWRSRLQAAPMRWKLSHLDAATQVSHRFESGKWVLLFEIPHCEPAKLAVSFAQYTENPLPPTIRSKGLATDFATRWISICEKTHLSCRRANSALPTRVIQVLAIGEELKVSLGIKLSWLSPTFREAIKFTRGIGLQYIWIDALCILQDDADDWARESEKMADIYRNAYITLNAFVSADGTGQCTPAYEPTNLVDYACRFEGEGGEVYVHEEDGEIADVYESEGLIQTRGWVFQEEQLSRRRLYCGQHHLVWKCAEMWARNDRPFGFSGEGFDTPFMSGYPCSSNWKVAYRQWRQMIQAYTMRKLTRARKDKLAAISGLAAAFDQGFPGKPPAPYLAGIWRGDICRGLLWYRQGGPASPCGGPSWSWASWDSPIGFELEDDCTGWPVRVTLQHRKKVLFKVQEASTTLHNPNNKYGRVSSGRIVIEARVLENAWQLYPQSQNEGTAPSDPLIHFDDSPYFENDSILLPITHRSGLLLRPVERTATDTTPVYRRIGLCVRPEEHGNFDWLPAPVWKRQYLTLI